MLALIDTIISLVTGQNTLCVFYNHQRPVKTKYNIISQLNAVFCDVLAFQPFSQPFNCIHQVLNRIRDRFQPFDDIIAAPVVQIARTDIDETYGVGRQITVFLVIRLQVKRYVLDVLLMPFKPSENIFD